MYAGRHAPRSRRQIALLIAGGGAGIFFIAEFLLLGFLAPGYDPLRQTISALEFTSFGRAQQGCFILFGLLLACFALGLRKELIGGRGAILIPLFQFLSACAVIGDGFFIHWPLHMICDWIAFDAALAVLFLFAWRLWGNRDWRGWPVFSILVALVMMAWLAAFGYANAYGGPAGLFEKLATASRTLWSVLLVSRLLTGRNFRPQ
jgi:hypothetical protein